MHESLLTKLFGPSNHGSSDLTRAENQLRDGLMKFGLVEVVIFSMYCSLYHRNLCSLTECYKKLHFQTLSDDFIDLYFIAF